MRKGQGSRNFPSGLSFVATEDEVQRMNDGPNQSNADEQAITGARNERVREPKRRRHAGGVHGPVKDNDADYKTHYGETAYGGGQKRYGGQAPVQDLSKGDDGRAEGKAGSKATLPGAGADRGPPEPR